MKVYEIDTVCEKWQGDDCLRIFATLERSQDYGEFKGEPLSRKWRPLSFYVDKPRLPRPDFYDLVGALIVEEKTVGILGDVLHKAGELLPIKVRGERGKYFIFNVTNVTRNAVDKGKSKWEPDVPLLLRPFFRSNKLGKLSIFKIPEDGATGLFCIERTGNAADAEFKALAKQHRLTGLEFKLVWSDERKQGRSAEPPGKKNPAASRRKEKRPGATPAAFDRPLTPNESEEIRTAVARGYQRLKLDPQKTPPGEAQKAILRALDQVLVGKRKLKSEARWSWAIDLGFLWGQIVCDKAGWLWCIASLNGTEAFAIVNPNRSYAVLPAGYFHDQLGRRPPEDNTSLLLYNSIKDGEFSKGKTRSYTTIG